MTLREGDYSVSLSGSNPLSIRLERKSLSDLYSCFGQYRERASSPNSHGYVNMIIGPSSSKRR
jgi:hypothetical protein